MSTRDELAAVLERSAALVRQSHLVIAASRRVGGAISLSPRPQSLLLLLMTERLIDAHRIAKLDGDGTTIDAVQDALVFVGRRLARETHSDGPSVRAILGHWHRQEPDGRPIVIARYLDSRDPGFQNYVAESVRHAEAAGLSPADLRALRAMAGAIGRRL